jgi:hypothetical protein
MRYAVLTTKHHDGFCLWDSALTEYKSTNTPAGRDMSRYVDYLHGQLRELLTAHQPDVLWLLVQYTYSNLQYSVTVLGCALAWRVWVFGGQVA